MAANHPTVVTITSLSAEKPWWRRLEREGIPLEQYRWAHLLPTLPFTGALHVAFKAIGRTCQEEEPVGPVKIPSNAIVYLWHGDSYLSFVTPKFWHSLYCEHMSWLGFHGALSYLGSSWPYLMGVRCFRYDRQSSMRPLNQVTDYLKGAPGMFAIRTDAGGPYGHVRASLVEMSLVTNRPLVAIRQRATQAIIVRQHALPMPGARIATFVSSPVFPDQLRHLSREEARQLLQETIDRL